MGTNFIVLERYDVAYEAYLPIETNTPITDDLGTGQYTPLISNEALMKIRYRGEGTNTDSAFTMSDSGLSFSTNQGSSWTSSSINLTTTSSNQEVWVKHNSPASLSFMQSSYKQINLTSAEAAFTDTNLIEYYYNLNLDIYRQPELSVSFNAATLKYTATANPATVDIDASPYTLAEWVSWLNLNLNRSGETAYLGDVVGEDVNVKAYIIEGSTPVFTNTVIVTPGANARPQLEISFNPNTLRHTATVTPATFTSQVAGEIDLATTTVWSFGANGQRSDASVYLGDFYYNGATAGIAYVYWEDPYDFTILRSADVNLTLGANSIPQLEIEQLPNGQYAATVTPTSYLDNLTEIQLVESVLWTYDQSTLVGSPKDLSLYNGVEMQVYVSYIDSSSLEVRSATTYLTPQELVVPQTLILNFEDNLVDSGADPISNVTSSGTNFTLGYYGQAIEAPTTGNKVTIPMTTGSKHYIGDKDYTICFWFKYNSITGGNQDFFEYGVYSQGLYMRTTNGNLEPHFNSGSPADSIPTGAVAGEWYHFAITRASGVTRIFVDGIKKWENSVVYNMGGETYGITLLNSYNSGGSRPLRGAMDSFRIYKNEALWTSNFDPDSLEGPPPPPPASVTIAVSPSSSVAPGTQVTFTATPLNSTSPSYQWYKNNAIISNATSSTYVSSSLSTNDVIKVKLTDSGSDYFSNEITITVITLTPLILNFENSLEDTGPEPISNVTSTATSYVPGYYNTAISAVSSTSKVTIPMTTGSKHYIGNKDYTICFWFKYNSITGGNQDFFEYGRYDAGLYMRTTNGNLEPHFNSGSYAASIATGAVAGEWSHFAITRANGVTRIFIDGIKKWENSVVYNMGGETYGITVLACGHSTGRQLNGAMDSFRIYNNAALWTSDFDPESIEPPQNSNGITIPATIVAGTGYQSVDIITGDLATKAATLDAYFSSTSTWSKVRYYYKHATSNQIKGIEFNYADNFSSKSIFFSGRAQKGTWNLIKIVLFDKDGGELLITEGLNESITVS